MRRTVIFVAGACALAAVGTTILAAPGQDRPGQLTQARTLIDNRGRGQAIPVSIENESLDRPLRVQVVESPAALPTRAVRQGWEYQTVRVPFGQDPTATLAPLGLQGWEATGNQFGNPDGSALLLMRRPQ
jgi:hypothetical protein